MAAVPGFPILHPVSGRTGSLHHSGPTGGGANDPEPTLALFPAGERTAMLSLTWAPESGYSPHAAG
jgi:hypothetical protein